MMKLKIKNMKLKNRKKKLKELKYERKKYVYDFQIFETVRSFGDNIYNDKISIKEAEMVQTNLLENILDFSNKSRPRSKKDKERLPIALAQVKAGNTSENLLNEIRQIIYSLYQEKEITKKVYKNIMNSIKV